MNFVKSIQPDCSLKCKLQLNFAIALSYFLFGIFAQIATMPESHASTIWPSAGIAMGSLLLFGPWVLPGIFIGCFGIHAWSFNFNSELIIVYFFISLGAVIGAYSGFLLINKMRSSSTALLKKKDIVFFLLFAGPISSVIPSTINIITVSLTDIITSTELFKHWFVWWSGYAVGGIVFTPTMLILFAQPRKFWVNRVVSVALPSFIMYLFLTLFYQFTIKIASQNNLELVNKVNLENFNLYFLSILFYGLSFAFLIIAVLLIISGQNSRIEMVNKARNAFFVKRKNDQQHCQLQLQLQNDKNKAESANQAKNQFLSHISHELRTPLNGIMGFTQLLLKNRAFDKTDREKLNIIQNCSDHLLDLINDMQDISKIESGYIKLDPKPFDFKIFLTDLCQIFKLKADEKQIKFEAVYNSIPEYIIGDKKRLRQIFSNLMSNAIKFTEQGEVKITINFDQDELFFIVKDTGVGITDENSKKIFAPFVQVKPSRQTINGSGLGLAITLQILNLLEGSISVKSQLNEGSEFSVRIPLRTCQPINITTSQPNSVIGYEGAKKNIWIVDDNQENTNLMQLILRNLGFIVSTFQDGFECLEKLEQAPPDLIIMDMMLPVLNGIETNRSILEKNPKQKIIGMSASVFIDEQQRFLDSGCFAFIAKPFQEDDLLSALKSTLELTWKYDSLKSTEVEQTAATDHTVLVAEDNEINCLLLENLLISLQCKVDIVMDGGQALERLHSTPYKLALIDLQMPVMGGEDVVREIRSQTGPNQKTRIIAVSGFAEKHKAKALLKKGFDDFLSKPIQLENLETLVKDTVFKIN